MQDLHGDGWRDGGGVAGGLGVNSQVVDELDTKKELLFRIGSDSKKNPY